MRRVALVAALLLALAGCSAKPVPHVIEYELHMVGPNAFADIYAFYTGENGGEQKAKHFGGSWSKQITVKYPDVKKVSVWGSFSLPSSIPGQGTDPMVSALQCIIKVDGQVAAKDVKMAPSCEVKLSATAQPARAEARNG